MPETTRNPRPGQERFIAPLEETPLQAVDAVDTESSVSNLWIDAWRSLRKNPIFIVAALLILLIAVASAFPQLFTNAEPKFGDLNNSLDGPRDGSPLGFSQQGYDVFARLVYGARASVLVGVLTTILVIAIGVPIGALAGFYGGWLDAILSRITDIFFAIPFLLGAILVITAFKDSRNIWTVILVLGIFGWTQMARITRGAVIGMKNADFIMASTAIGTSRFLNLLRHALPNAIAPVIVTATVSLGIYIVAEATLSYLGLGLPTSVVSWGGDIAAAQSVVRIQPATLLWPAGGLALTVLSFIMLGDAVRDALDPKARTR